jgi:anti-sigma regulatory factor (Ser/Thr protein kinase)
MKPLPPERPHELRLDLPAAHSAERMARAVLRQFAVREHVPAKEIETLEFVASELLSNAVDHGGGRRAMEESEVKDGVRMSLFLVVKETAWSLSVSDQGGGDPDQMAAHLSRDDLPDIDEDRGRGFFLLKQMVDTLRVEKSRDGLGLEFTAVRSFVSRRS